MLTKSGQNLRVYHSSGATGSSFDASVALGAVGGVSSFIGISPVSLTSSAGVAPVFGATSLASLDQLLSPRLAPLAFEQASLKSIAQPILSPAYSTFTWSSLRSRVSAPLLTFSRPHVGGHLGLQTFVDFTSMGAAPTFPDTHAALRRLIELCAFNSAAVGSSPLTSSAVVGEKVGRRNVVSLEAYGFFLTEIAWASSIIVAPHLYEVKQAEGVSAPYWSWVYGSTPHIASAHLALIAHLYQVVLTQLTRLKLGLLALEGTVGGSKKAGRSSMDDTLRAMALAHHQVLMAKFTRLELRMLVPEEDGVGSSAFEAALRAEIKRVRGFLIAIRIRVLQATGSLVQSALTTSLSTLDHFRGLFRECVYAPVYLYVMCVSQPLHTLRSLMSRVGEAYFFCNLGLMSVLGLVSAQRVGSHLVVKSPRSVFFFLRRSLGRIALQLPSFVHCT